MKTQRPLFLLAFANDRAGEFLRNISVENQKINSILETVEDQIQVKSLASADWANIASSFKKYRNQIKVFHYGGHSSGIELKLNNSQNVDASLMANFLGNQKGIDLIFLNGCLTSSQSVFFLNAGIPNVISTTQNISDKAALKFATKFYESIITGASIKAAYDEARNETLIELGNNFRSLYWKGETNREYPWELISSSTESSKKIIIPTQINTRIKQESLSEKKSLTQTIQGDLTELNRKRERDLFYKSEKGVKTALNEFRTLIQQIEELKTENFDKHSEEISFKIEYERRHSPQEAISIFCHHGSIILEWQYHTTNTLEGSQLVLTEFDNFKALSRDKNNHHYVLKSYVAVVNSQRIFDFSYIDSSKFGWKEKLPRTKVYSSKELADEIIARFWKLTYSNYKSEKYRDDF